MGFVIRQFRHVSIDLYLFSYCFSISAYNSYSCVRSWIMPQSLSCLAWIYFTSFIPSLKSMALALY
jgi:hypothetical protein